MSEFVTEGFCPQCKTAPVVRVKKYGTFPRCEACLEENKRGRYDRANEKRRGKQTAHYRISGERYSDHAAMVRLTCSFCLNEFERSSRLRGRPVCEGCRPKAAEERRVKNLEKVKKLYWKDPEAAKRKRLARTLLAMGLTIEWYDSQPQKCAVCGTTEPGEKGWCIDHDHQCCPYGVRQGCSKCVRGLLCNNCNRGLGYFKDDPVRLQAAITYLARSVAGPRPEPT